MVLSESVERLRKAIVKAINNRITPEEYNEIIRVSMKNGYIRDSQERALLSHLQRIVKKKEVGFEKVK